ncbi:unnamed protein product [Parnassius apollo]|uniref:(apollo) hypothetical protein n=1 Tax=Parnassius apollo TaxID=110799 RepID=A0A8S3WNV1_PARAO|nr:unnamed protein product [Parnassius apollo]
MHLNVVCQWAHRNKLLLIFALLSFCFCISTISLIAKNKRLTKACSAQQAMNLNEIAPVTQEKITPSSRKVQNSHYILPRNVKPLNYKLILAPNIFNKTFVGDVKILLQVLKPTKSITMHAKNLIIHSVTLKDAENHTLDIISITSSGDLNSEMLQINLQRTLKQMDAVLLIHFSGRLDKKIIGFYASS